MTVSRHQYAASMVSTVSVDIPGPDVFHPAEWPYAQTFDGLPTGTTAAAVDSWTTVNGTLQNDFYGTPPDAYFAHSGAQCLQGTSPAAGAKTIRRTVAGLVPGASYTLSGWFRTIDSIPYGDTALAGVTGIGAGSAVPIVQASGAAASWFNLSFSFIATAVSHQIYFTMTSNYTGGYGLWDDLTLTRNAYTESTPGKTYPAGTTIPLDVIAGSVALDETVSPYAQASLQITTPGPDVIALLNPLKPPRVRLVATEINDDLQNNTRTFDLVLRGRSRTHEQGETTLTLASDDALLQDYSYRGASPDYALLTLQNSLASVVSSVVSRATGKTISNQLPAVVPFVTLSAEENLAENPTAALALDGYVLLSPASGSTITRQPATYPAGVPATTSAMATFGAGQTSSGGIRYTQPNIVPGTIYSVSEYARPSGIDGQILALRIVWVNSAGVEVGNRYYSTNATTSNNAWTRFVRRGMRAPNGAATAYVDILASNGVAWPTSSKLYLGGILWTVGGGLDTDNQTLLPYFDGATANTAAYNFGWSAAANSSSSTRTPVTERPKDTLVWNPGVSAFDLLSPILTATNTRLFCDELGQFYLVNNDYHPDGLVTIAEGYNLYSATDSVDRSLTAVDGSPLFFDSAIVHYTWTDTNGVYQERWDAYAPVGSTQTYTLDVDRPYPGPGAAKYMVSRNSNRAASLALGTRQDWSVRPGQQAQVSLPDTLQIRGYVAGVTWALGDEDDMQITTRGLISYTSTAWALQPNSMTWASLPNTTTWANFQGA